MRVVGLFYSRCHLDLTEMAAKCVSSVRKHIPQVHVVHFTDTQTPKFPFADEVVRKFPRNLGLMEFRIHHFSTYPHTEALFLDADTVVQGDVWDVFSDPFDVALTYRHKRLIDKATKADLTAAMPYNTGVMFSRGQGFWKRVCELVKPMPLDERNWFGEQKAIAQLARSGEFHVKEISDEVYNYTPNMRGEDLSGRLIVHYKGNRKDWACES